MGKTPRKSASKAASKASGTPVSAPDEWSYYETNQGWQSVLFQKWEFSDGPFYHLETLEDPYVFSFGTVDKTQFDERARAFIESPVQPLEPASLQKMRVLMVLAHQDTRRQRDSESPPVRSSPKKTGAHVAKPVTKKTPSTPQGTSESSGSRTTRTPRSRRIVEESLSPVPKRALKRLKRGSRVREFIDDAASDGTGSDEGSKNSLDSFVDDSALMNDSGAADSDEKSVEFSDDDPVESHRTVFPCQRCIRASKTWILLCVLVRVI